MHASSSLSLACACMCTNTYTPHTTPPPPPPHTHTHTLSQAKRLGHYIYFHPHDSRREELFCYYKRDPDLKPHDDSPQEKGRRVNQCMRLQKLTREQQKWMEGMCTVRDDIKQISQKKYGCLKNRGGD